MSNPILIIQNAGFGETPVPADAFWQPGEEIGTASDEAPETGVDAIVRAVEQRDREAAAFVDFVLRHTWPERAARHGAATVYSLIENHPFAKAHARQNDKG